MSDLVNLSQCIVDSDSKELGRTRRLRGRALIASIAIETSVLTGMLLWPLLNPAILPSQPILAPVPVFHPAPHQEIVNTPLVSDREPRRPSILDRGLHQPPQIPQHIAGNVDSEPPVDYESVGPTAPDGLGVAGAGDRTESTYIARPEPSSHPNRPIPRSSGVMNALLIYRVEPEYPLPAKWMRLSGTVQLRAIIGTDGRIRNIEIVNGTPIFAKAAVAAVEQWRYQPTLLSGKPVEVETLITVEFHMN